MTQLSTSLTESKPVPAGCPRCQKPLVDPSGLGWCKSCGYCKSLEESETTAGQTAEAKPAPQNTVTATGSALGQTPTWFWVTLVGLVMVVGAIYACGHYLTLTPLHRAMLTTVVMIAGAGLMFVGQFMALLRIAPEESTLSFKDAVIPFRLYGLVLKCLPGTRFTIYFGTWGFAAIIASAVLIGGLGHWFTLLPGYKASPTQKTKSAR